MKISFDHKNKHNKYNVSKQNWVFAYDSNEIPVPREFRILKRRKKMANFELQANFD